MPGRSEGISSGRLEDSAELSLQQEFRLSRRCIKGLVAMPVPKGKYLSRTQSRASSTIAALRTATAIVVLSAALNGCSPASVPSEGSTVSSSPASPLATADDTGATSPLDFDSFNTINRNTIVSIGDASGADLTDALLSAGFDRSRLEVTADSTTEGKRADAIFVAVKSGETCFVGQYRTKASGEDGDAKYLGARVAPLATGRCLIGDPVPIE